MNFESRLKFNALNFLLIFNTLVFALSLLVHYKIGFDSSIFYVFGGEIPSKIYEGSWWLLVTPNFFHIEILHYGFNMFTLTRIGEIIINYYNGTKLFTVYIFGGIGGTLLSYFISYITHQDSYSLGASASIFALIGLLVGGTLKKYRYGLELPFSAMDILPFALVSFLFGLTPGLNINNWAHLGGFITGILFGLIINHSLAGYESKLEKYFADFLYYVSVIIFIASYIFLLVTGYNLIFK